MSVEGELPCRVPTEIPLHRQRAVCMAAYRLIADAEARLSNSLGSSLLGAAPLQGAAPLRITLAGGAAMALYSPSRLSEDVDAIFSRQIPLPETMVYYSTESGERRTLSWDRNYSPTLGLLHPEAESDALFVARTPEEKLEIMVLTPTDLAVSKLARYAENDQRDIHDLYAMGLIHPESLLVRAMEAMDYYVGDEMQVRHNVVCALEGMGCFLPLPPMEDRFAQPTHLLRTDAHRLMDGGSSDLPTHCLDNGSISGTLCMMSEDRSVAFLMKKESMVMVYRGDGKTMPWLSARKGMHLTIEAIEVATPAFVGLTELQPSVEVQSLMCIPASSLERDFHHALIPRLNDPARHGEVDVTAIVLALVKDANMNAFALVEANGKAFAAPISDPDRDRLSTGREATFRITHGERYCAIISPQIIAGPEPIPDDGLCRVTKNHDADPD